MSPLMRLQTAFGFLLLVASGCAGPTFRNSEADLQPLAGGPELPTYIVEVRDDDSEPVQWQGTLDGPLVVDDAIERSGLRRRFRKMFITLERRVANGKLLRLDVPYNRVGRRVEPSHDYALQPGDRVVVEEDKRTVIDEMVESILSPVSPMMRRVATH